MIEPKKEIEELKTRIKKLENKFSRYIKNKKSSENAGFH